MSPHAASEEAPAASDRRRLRILLAEDDDELRRSLTTILRQRGHDVRAFGDGFALVDAIGECVLLEPLEELDVIVTDVRLPGFNGLGAVEGMRRAGRDVPVVLISAFGDEELRERVDRLPRTELVTKPFRSQALLDAIERVASREE